MEWTGEATVYTWVILHRQTQNGNDRVCFEIKYAEMRQVQDKEAFGRETAEHFSKHLPFVKG